MRLLTSPVFRHLSRLCPRFPPRCQPCTQANVVEGHEDANNYRCRCLRPYRHHRRAYRQGVSVPHDVLINIPWRWQSHCVPTAFRSKQSAFIPKFLAFVEIFEISLPTTMCIPFRPGILGSPVPFFRVYPSFFYGENCEEWYLVDAQGISYFRSQSSILDRDTEMNAFTTL